MENNTENRREDVPLSNTDHSAAKTGEDTAAGVNADTTTKEPVCATIQSTMTKEALFDFYLFHAYSKFSGFLTNILGLAVFFLGVFSYVSGKISAVGCAIFVIASIGFLGYTPLLLRRKAARELRDGIVPAGPMEITFTDKSGITVRNNDKKTFYPWENVLRASVTPKTIAIYVNTEEAIIIPKQDFRDKFALCYQIIAVNLHQRKL